MGRQDVISDEASGVSEQASQRTGPVAVIDRRRSVRHLLGQECEVHIGPNTVTGIVRDVSQHGIGLELPKDTDVQMGDLIWLLIRDIASYAITATVVRMSSGTIGAEFEEILVGEALEKVESLPTHDEGLLAPRNKR